MPSYNVWTKHGEEGVMMEDGDEEEDNDDQYRSMFSECDDTAMEDNEEEGGEEQASDDPVDDDLRRAISDARRDCGTDKERLQFDKMLEDHHKLLYPGCEDGQRKLGSILELLKWKAEAGVTDSGFEKLLIILKKLLPRNNELPVSTYEAKKLVCPLGLDVQKIHACINDCILYRGEKYENLNKCPICGALRYKIRRDDPGDVEGEPPRKRVPAKVMWYAPIIPRLKRLFRNKEHAKLLRWHMEERKKDAMLRHPADGRQWRNIGREFPDFAGFLGVYGKTKDTTETREDQKHHKGRDGNHPGKFEGPASYALTKQEKEIFFEALFSIKVPSGFSSNIKGIVNMKEKKFQNLKSHDCHVLMTQLLPVALRGLLPENVRLAIVKICAFLNAISQKVMDPETLSGLQADVVECLVSFELLFPPSFFNIMTHLLVHLVEEIRILGPVFLHNMFPFERFMGVLKKYVHNRARPEGSISKGYGTEEVIEFCVDFLPDLKPIGVPESRQHILARPVGHSTTTASTSATEMAGTPVTYDELTEDHKKNYDAIKSQFEADLIGSFERTRSHGVRWKGFSPEGVLDGVDLSLPSEERTRALRQEVNYMVAHSMHRFSESLLNSLERIAVRVVQEIMKHQYSPSGPTLGTHQGEIPLYTRPQLPFTLAASEQQASPAYVVYKVGGDPGDCQFLSEPPKEIPHGYVCTYVPDCNNFTRTNQIAAAGISAGGVSGADADKQAWLAKYATGTSHETSHWTSFGWYTSLPPDSVRTWKQLEEQFHVQYHSEATEAGIADLTQVRQKRGETVSEYIQRFRTVRNRCYSVRLNEKEVVELAALGLAAPLKDMALQADYNSLAHMVQKLTLYEQRHPELYQDKFIKRPITLVETAEVEDPEDQEVAVAEWARGAVPVSCKWVKP
ncbi:hypothetical protein QYE76_070898 [Lolium multiflorum]|uniref:Uncharacterized protein n=1 Tax=Lolium multiflorum TaxID=4521 RepID=A0AAD8SK89_LOLMU|nr:hypothetical protein QYE76_070898 [Lolium multiflorum]